MALNEQMQEAIQADIADESSKKERIAKQTEALKDTGKFVAETAVESIPGVSEGIAVRNVSRDLKEGDYVGAGIETLAGLAGLAPAGGDALAKAIRTFKPKKTVKAYKLFTKGEDGNLYPLFVDADTPIKKGEYIQAVIPDSVFTAPNGKKYVPSKGTGKKKGTGDNIPIPDKATRDLLIEKGFLKKGSKAKSVKAVALRPGWHAGDSPAAPHIGNEYKGKKFRAEDQVWAEVEMPADVDWQSIANKRAELKKDGTPNVKTAHITDELPLGGFYRYKTNPNMQGNWLISGQMKINRVLDADEVKRLNKEAGVKDLPTLDELKAKEMAKGGAVMDDYQFAELEMEAPKKFAEGGMSKQMEMFDDGGLMQEGGTVDPESGNEVPVGSTQEEVRDDIPAQLSEGEFVFPADVVRYWGLDTLMRMRQQAKMGLKLMDKMGQMGNSEEATLPDDIPFDINDLDMEDDGVLEYQVGGFVQPFGTQQQTGTGVSGYQQSQFANYQPQYQVYQQPTALPQTTYTAPIQQQVPTMPQMQQIPTFTDLTGTAQPGEGGYDELRTYVNDAGQEMQIPFKNGEPIYPIPEGYKPKGDAVGTATTQSTTVSGDTGVVGSGSDDDGGTGTTTPSGSTLSFGGEINRKGTVSNSIRGDLSFRSASFFDGPLGKFKGSRDLLGRAVSSGASQLTGGKLGTPMTLKEGESAVISNLVQTRPGVNRSEAIAVGVSLELPASFYNKHVSGKTVTGRKTLEKVANYVDKNYDGLAEGSIVNAEQILAEIEKQEKEAKMAAAVAEAQRKAEEAQRIADEQARQAALDAAYGARDDSSSTGYTPGSVIDNAIRDAQDYMSQQDSSSDEGGQFGGTVYDGGGYDPTGGAGYGTGTDCLTERMKVKLNGAIDFVTNVKVGDIIDNFRVKEVIHKHMRDGYFVINNELEITNDHPVLANGTWTKPEELYIGDYINHVKVESIKYVDRVTPTVSIIVDGDSFDVYTENNTYTVHGRYKEVRQQAA